MLKKNASYLLYIEPGSRRHPTRSEQLTRSNKRKTQETNVEPYTEGQETKCIQRGEEDIIVDTGQHRDAAARIINSV